MPSPARRYAAPAGQAEDVETLLAAGAYASPEEVISAGFAALRARDDELSQPFPGAGCQICPSSDYPAYRRGDG